VSLAQQGGGGAMEAYAVGHEAACDAAREGDTNKALALNACASHYLSDLFAPGHQTQSRRAVLAHANSFLTTPVRAAKNFYTKWMHDEANKAGMMFTNARGDVWRGYGDACNGFWGNRRNSEIQLETLSASAQAVLDTLANASQGKASKASHAACIADAATKHLAPDTSKVQDLAWLKANKELSPMFYSTDGKTILKRGTDCNGFITTVITEFCDAQIYNHTGVDGADPCRGLGGHTFNLLPSDPCGNVAHQGKHNYHNAPRKTAVCDGSYRYINPGHNNPQPAGYPGDSQRGDHQRWCNADDDAALTKVANANGFGGQYNCVEHAYAYCSNEEVKKACPTTCGCE
jgi:hypothetical protein